MPRGLKNTGIDPASFTSIRLLAGALMLWLLVAMRRSLHEGHGNWRSAAALFGYAAAYSFAYIHLTAATGALLLFGAVQATMIGHGIRAGERLHGSQWLGLALALAGLVGLLLPGLTAPTLFASLLMLGAGAAWGVYSLRGKGAGDPTRITAGNFMRAVPIALVLSLFTLQHFALDTMGIVYAVLSGGPDLRHRLRHLVRRAASAQGHASRHHAAQRAGHRRPGRHLFLHEPLTVRAVLASVAILGGIALVILEKRSENSV